MLFVPINSYTGKDAGKERTEPFGFLHPCAHKQSQESAYTSGCFTVSDRLQKVTFCQIFKKTFSETPYENMWISVIINTV